MKKKSFCRDNQVKALEMRSSWINQVNPKSKDKCLYKTQKRRRHKERRGKPRGDGNRDWHDTATSQDAGELEEARKPRLPSDFQKKHSPADTSLFHFWPPEPNCKIIKVCVVMSNEYSL